MERTKGYLLFNDSRKPRKIKVFQRRASKKGIRFRVRPVMTTSILLHIILLTGSSPSILTPRGLFFKNDWLETETQKGGFSNAKTAPKSKHLFPI